MGHRFTMPPRMSTMDRFWAKVDKTETCWLWTASKTKDGYGVFNYLRQNGTAHRLAYELLVGPVDPSLDIDHLCRVRHCVNPEHLEPVSHRENMRRSESWAGKKARQTTCIRGHAFTPENTYVRPGQGRSCRACDVIRKLERAVRRRGGEIPATVVHGKVSTYKNWHCRCVQCKNAQSDNWKNYYETSLVGRLGQ